MSSVYVQRQRIIRTWLLLLVKLNTSNNTSGRMITLSKKLRQEKASEGSSVLHNASTKRISVRDKLLAKEVQELNQALPTTCRVRFDNPDILHEFQVTITPDESFWKGGKFVFQVSVTEEYNIAPPIARCLTKLWHPNITEDGEICLSILRQNSIDGMGWAPTRRLKDVVWGINSLFTDLLNFDDPLNIEAAEQFRKDRDAFETKVKDYVNKYAKR